MTSEKLSSPDVSVKVMPLRLARTGVSFAPARVVVSVWLALFVPSLATTVKLSLCCDVRGSMALSSGTYLYAPEELLIYSVP